MRKKLVLLLVIFITISTVAFSQSNRSDKDGIGGYIAMPLMGTSFFNFSQLAMLSGLRGGITIDDTYIIGLTMSSAVPRGSVRIFGDDTDSDYIGFMYYGGLFFEYIIMSENRIHFSIPVELVLGAAHVGNFNIFGDGYDEEDGIVFFHPNVFWGIIPGANFNINLGRFFVLGVHVGYRFAILEETKYIKNHYDIWGIQTGMLFQFVW